MKLYTNDKMEENNEKLQYEIELLCLKLNEDYIELNSNCGIDCDIVRNAMEKDPIPKVIY